MVGCLECCPRPTGWFNGDFNYDCVMNASDYTLIDNACNTQGTMVVMHKARNFGVLPSASAFGRVEPGRRPALMKGHCLPPKCDHAQGQPQHTLLLSSIKTLLFYQRVSVD